MIKTFADRHTLEVCRAERSRRLPADLLRRAVRRLEYLDHATSLEDLKTPPSNRILAVSPRERGAPAAGAPDSRARRGGRHHQEETEPELEQRVAAYTQYALAVSAELNDREAEALDLFYQAAMAHPTRRDLVVQVVGRLLQARQHDRAVAVLLRATSLPTAEGELFAWLGFAYTAQGKMDLAIEANRQAIRHDPTLLLAYRNLTLLYSQIRRPDLALEVLNEAARRPAADAPFLVWLEGLSARCLHVSLLP